MYGSRVGEQQRRKHNIQSQFCSGNIQGSKRAGQRNKVNDWIGAKIDGYRGKLAVHCAVCGV